MATGNYVIADVFYDGMETMGAGMRFASRSALAKHVKDYVYLTSLTGGVFTVARGEDDGGEFYVSAGLGGKGGVKVVIESAGIKPAPVSNGTPTGKAWA